MGAKLRRARNRLRIEHERRLCAEKFLWKFGDNLRAPRIGSVVVRNGNSQVVTVPRAIVRLEMNGGEIHVDAGVIPVYEVPR